MSRNDPAGGPAPSIEIDRLVHEPARLHILTLLQNVADADFLFIMRQTGLTKGNLSSHLAKLEAGGYVAIQKTYRDKIPLTLVCISPQRSSALDGYRRRMQQLLRPPEE